MIKLANDIYLYGLLLIPFFILSYIILLKWKKKSLALYGNSELINRLISNKSKSRELLKFILFSIAFIFLIIGIANPQLGSKIEKVHRKGIDLIIALDISNSMLAEDIKPNRLEKAKYAILKLIDKLEDDRLGLVIFAGSAYNQLPITSDHSAAKMFVSTLNTELISSQGTAISAALDLAQNSFQEDSKNNKAIVVISDGEDHEEGALEKAKTIAEKGIRIFTIGIGSPDGSPIPVAKFNNQFKSDKEGKVVITKLNEIILQQIAATGNGMYVRATASETGLNTIFKEINKMEKQEYDNKVFTDYEDRYQYFIAIALLLLIIESLLLERRNKLLSRLNPFNKDFVFKSYIMRIILLLLVLSATNLYSQSKEAQIRKGNNLYKSQKYSEAEVSYLKSLDKNQLYTKGLYNLGAAYYKQKRYKEADSILKNALSSNSDKNINSKIFHNLGNALLQEGNYAASVEAYKNSLKINPNDEDTRYNLAYAQKMLKNQKQNKQDKNNQDKQQQQQDKQQQDKQQQDKQQQQQDKQQQDKQKQQQDKQEQSKEQQAQEQQGKQGDKKISKQDAEKMLEALRKNEKDIINKLEKQKYQIRTIKIEKDW
ncbi:MAG: VWA domain-containing protein [Bacteroidales bacterium]|nr:VWA domain-containing protein [Bacteroidales bacterium]